MAGSVNDACERLRSCMTRSGMSKASVAAQLSISVPQLYAWLNPNNNRFPDPFQLERICRTLDTDYIYIVTGEYENLIQEFIVGQDKECAAAAKGMIGIISTAVLRKPGVRPSVFYYQSELSTSDLLNRARRQLRDALPESSDIQELADTMGICANKIHRWIRVKSPSGFPDAFTLLDICKVLGLQLTDIVSDSHEGQDLEVFLSKLSREELGTVKNFAATLMSSVFRL